MTTTTAKPNWDAKAVTELAKIPNTGDIDQWDEAQVGLAEVLGFTTIINQQRVIAPRGVREAFLIALDRTQLDPINRQIYLAYIGGKWLIIVGIDGFRLIAQRSSEYRGQDAPEWTSDDPADTVWHDVWLDAKNPGACRVGVYRKGFKKAIIGIATWKAYGKTNGQWDKNGPHMLSIRAEAQALRKAFPMELSGLYAREEFDDDTALADAPTLSRDWASEAKLIKDAEELKALYNELAEAGEWNSDLDSVFKQQKAKIAIAAAKGETIVVEEVPNAV